MAGLSCGMTCLKYLLFAFNFIVWVCGIAVLGVGIYSRIKLSDWDSIIDDSTIPNAANIMIAAGVFVMIIGFLGCCGAWKESKCLLISYAIALILIFVLEIAAGIYAYTKKDTVVDALEKGLNTTIANSYGETDKSSEGLTKSVDWFQENVKCCGSVSHADWQGSKWYSKQNKTGAHLLVPESCCLNKATDCSKGTAVADVLSKIHPNGCVKEGETYIKDHMWQIGGVGVGIAFVQLFGIVIAILLCRAIGYEKV